MRSQWCGFYDCDSPIDLDKNNLDVNNSTRESWILLYSTPLFGINYEFKGALVFKLNLSRLDINQCETGDDLFSNTHKCKKNTKCLFNKNHGFRLGGYNCQCFSGSKSTPSIVNAYNGTNVEREYWLLKNMKNNVYNESFNCLDCNQDCCIRFKNESNEINQFENLKNSFFNACKYNIDNKTMRMTLLAIQCFMIFIAVSTMIVIYKFRNNKVWTY